MKKLNENTLYVKFLKFEHQNNYFEISYKGLPIWEYSRMLIYTELQTRIKGLTPSLPISKPVGDKDICKEIETNCIDLTTLKKSDILLMGNPRRILQSDGKYYDITTDFIPSILSNYSCQTIEDPFWALFPNLNISHSLPSFTKNILYLDFIEKEYFSKLYSDIFFHDRKEIHTILTKIAEDIKLEFGIEINNSLELCENKLLYFIFAKPIYLQILQKIKPKVVMLFYHPHHSEYLMTMVAKELHIPVIEIQHGIIGEFEPIWHKYYNSKSPAKYLPDYIFGFSPTFINSENMILKDKIRYVGYPFLNKKIEEYKSLFTNKNEHNILIISQANLSDELSKFTEKLALLLQKNNLDYHIFYKLHPYELDKKFNNLNHPNVTIVRDLKKDIYYYQSICDIQIGVYSTAIYEGTKFNTTTIIIKGLMGWRESYKILKSLNGVYIATKPNDVLNIILSNPQKTSIDNNLWGDFSVSRYQKFIKEIMDANN